jgi:hypothetical protein
MPPPSPQSDAAPAEKPKRWLAELPRRLPLIKAFFRASGGIHRAAFTEFFIFWFCSLLPVILSVIIDYATGFSRRIGVVHDSDGIWYGLLRRIYGNVNAGEVFIYIISFVGTTVLVLYRYNENRKRFPEFLAVAGATFVIVVPSIVFFGLQKTSAVTNRSFVNIFALILYIAALFVWYVSLLYEHIRGESYTGELHNQESDLLEEVGNFRPDVGGSAS